ncbi:MAG: T9SS type A sorting domain-containing protein [Cytophagales bacterium]
MKTAFLRLIALFFFVFNLNSQVFSAEFYRLQSGSTTITGLSTTVTIDYVCKDQSFLVFTTTVDNNEPRDCHVGGEITDATTLTFEKQTGGGSTVEIRWQVFEFSAGVSVQHGSNNVNAIQDIAISTIDRAKSFVLCSGKKDGVTFGTDDFVEATLTSTTNLRLRVSGGQHTEAFWQVVEFDSAFVQRVGTSLPAGQDSITSTIATPVDKSKTLLINSHRVGGNVNSDDLPRVEFTDSVSLSFIREGTTRTIDLLTFVVEFSDGTSVIHGKDTFATGEVTKDITVSEISSSTGVFGTGHQLKQGSTTFNSDDNTGHNWFTYEFTSNTNLRISRDVGTGSSAIAPYQIVTFNDPSNTTFYTRASGAWDNNNTWSYASDGSSGAVPTNVWPSRNDNVVIRNGHTVTVNAINDNQLCGLSPDDLNQANIGSFTSSNVDMFYHTGDIIVDNGGIFSISTRSMFGGFTYVNGTLNSTQDIVNIANLEVTSNGSFNTNDDLILSGNSLTILDNTSTTNDDLYIDNTDALLCGSGILNLGNGDPDPEIQYLNGATEAQVCSYISITCNSNCGVAPFVTPTNTGNFSLGIVGPGGVGNSNDNKLWLRANDLSQVNGSSVDFWPDTSGNGIDANANTPLLVSNQPVFSTNAVNSTLPSILFDGGDLLNLGSDSLNFVPQTDEFSFFVSYNVNAGNTGTLFSKAVTSSPSRQYQFYIDNSDRYSSFIGGSGNNGTTSTATGSWKVGSSTISTSSTGYNSYLIGTAEVANGNVGTGTTASSDVLVGARRINSSTASFSQALDGEIGDIAVYNREVNNAERVIIENYLSAKYDISLGSNEIYEMDENSNGDFDFEVAGIGQASDGSFHKDSKGKGLVRMSLPKDIDNNEYLIWGHDGTPISTINFSDVDSTIIEARLERVWRVSENDASGNPVDIGTVRLTFDGNNLPSSILGSDIRLLITRDDSLFFDNDVTPKPGSYNIDNQLITFNNVSFQDGDYFTLGTINNTRSPLPIELLNFEASIENENVVLNWVTTREVNNDFYTIERSENSFSWEEIGNTPADLSESELKEYFYLDQNPYIGINYYRLKQTDLDGKFTYSKIRFVNFNKDISTQLSVFPNPNSGEFRIINEESDIEFLKMYDMLGNEIFIHSELSGNNALIKVDNVKKGIYLLRINQKLARIVIQ